MNGQGIAESVVEQAALAGLEAIGRAESLPLRISAMNHNPHNHHRRSIRLKGYDYSQPGAYFVTIATQDRACLFGAVVDGKMRLNAFGGIVREEWFRTAQLRPYVVLREDEFIVMPNHIHGIIWIVDGSNGVGAAVGAQRRCAPSDIPTARGITPTNVIPGSVGAIIRAFKSATTRRINAYRQTPGAPLWQRNYYEHIIRSEASLNRVRQYIAENSLRWAFDRENPAATDQEPEDAWVQ